MINLAPHANNVSIYLPGRPSQQTPDSQTLHLFMIPGNPGTIGHYHPFLLQLQDKVHASDPDLSLIVYGTSLPNYTDKFVRKRGDGGVLGLPEMADCMYERVVEYGRAQRDLNPGSRPVGLVLCGHSIGAYMCLEILERFRRGSSDLSAEVDIVGCLNLWPAIVWFGKSPNGLRMSPVLNSTILFSTLVFVGEHVVRRVPYQLLLAAIRRGSGQPEDVVRVTCDFLKSKYGFRQTVYLLRDTVNLVREDRWTANVWGSADSKSAEQPRSVFHFGRNDNAVEDKIRDELISLRGRSGDQGSIKAWKPIMEVDTENIPHAFFESESEIECHRKLI